MCKNTLYSIEISFIFCYIYIRNVKHRSLSLVYYHCLLLLFVIIIIIIIKLLITTLFSVFFFLFFFRKNTDSVYISLYINYK